MANGALGALSAWLENKRRIARRNVSDLLESPTDYGRMMDPRIDEDLTEQFSRPEAGLDFIAGPLGGLAGVIKPKGGNWLPEGITQALKSITPKAGAMDRLPKDVLDEMDRTYPQNVRETLSSETIAQIDRAYGPLRQKAAMQNWIEGPLRKYIMRDMATEGDPIRTLAEQNVLHVNPEQLNYNLRSHDLSPMPEQSFKAKSDLAKTWEGASDNKVFPIPAHLIQKSNSIYKIEAKDNPWISKLDPETRVFDIYEPDYFSNDLGFGHLVDELSNSLNPESGLPRNLLLRPEQMQQMGIEKAVRHVDAVNKWRAAQKIEANRKLAENAAIVREYPENNPLGLRWVELKADADDLAEQLRYEGDIMGHCVGGYCEDVIGGESRIFSLRDAKGEPHVTIETSPRSEGFNNLLNDEMAERLNVPRIEQIVQIKGKQNKNPKDEYLPFVQDFVKNSPTGSPWGDVGDFANTGMLKINNRYVTPDELENVAKRHFGERGNKPDEIEPAYEYYRRMKRYAPAMLSESDLNFIKDIEAGNFAEGGFVTDRAMLNRIISAYNQL